jgi:uncharacterized protein YicC (UPF0701 family)
MDADAMAREGLERRLARARAKLRQATTSRRRKTLRATVTRLHDNELDSAWIAALRGDVDEALDRFSPHVREEVPRHDSTGTPWRRTGWLGGS